MIDYQVRPIVTWPGKRSERRSSPFRAGNARMWQLLDHELAQLGCRELVLEMFVREGDIRIDGKPRADAKIQDPGVIVSFQSKFGPLRYPCDRFPRWEDNLYAIALALEALRKVERYGVTRRGEQYTGWKQLPEPGSAAAFGFRDAREAAAFLAATARLNGGTIDEALKSQDVAVSLYRAAVKVAHPDVGGSAEAFDRVNAARKALNAHHGIPG